MPRGSHLALALVASLLLHSAAIILIPQARLRFPATVETLVEIELAKPEKPPVPVLPPIEVPEAIPAVPPDVVPREPVEPQVQPRRESPSSEQTPEALSRALRSEAAPPTGLPRPAQPVDLPQRKQLRLDPEPLSFAEPSPPSTPGLPGALPRTQPRPASSGEGLRGAESAASGLLERMGTPPPDNAAARTGAAFPEIGGEVGRDRLVVHHPPPPQVEIANPATVEIEFWVSASGLVVRVQPLRRGEPELDRAAREYVKDFTFNPLPAGQRGEQRGTIRVRFQWR